MSLQRPGRLTGLTDCLSSFRFAPLQSGASRGRPNWVAALVTDVLVGSGPPCTLTHSGPHCSLQEIIDAFHAMQRTDGQQKESVVSVAYDVRRIYVA